MKTETARRQLRQSQFDQYNASALYGLATVDKTSHDVSYEPAGGGTGSIAADAVGMRNNEYARMRLQRLAGSAQSYRDGVPYGLPCRGAHLPTPLMPGVVEHIYESPDLVRRDAFQDEQYTPTTGPGRRHHQHLQHAAVAQAPPPPPQHHGYWPIPGATSQPEPTSPGAQCCSPTPKNSLNAKSTGNYSL